MCLGESMRRNKEQTTAETNITVGLSYPIHRILDENCVVCFLVYIRLDGYDESSSLQTAEQAISPPSSNRVSVCWCICHCLQVATLLFQQIDKMVTYQQHMGHLQRQLRKVVEESQSKVKGKNVWHPII